MAVSSPERNREIPEGSDLTTLAVRLFSTRAHSLRLAEPLSAEDMVVQASDEASPTKWHLAHVTWFFENFVLAPHLRGYRIFDDDFNYCFNSYYEALGPRHPRGRRGLLTRPSIERVFDYREHVDEALQRLFEQDRATEKIARLIEIGINHEQQHQELLLTDILALFAANPLRPAYQAARSRRRGEENIAPLGWIEFDGGIVSAGHSDNGFCWDNELPAHHALVHPFKIADRLVTNGEWLEFMEDGGYATAALWLSDGWTNVNREGWNSPLYWEKTGDGWAQMSLQGLQPVNRSEPVAHVSYYEADAFARWAGKRLPTEFEWEAVARANPTPSPCEREVFRPHAAESDNPGQAPKQLFGDVWQWTASAYLAYPGYRAPAGAIGEYNGKFMVGQHVLRGSSCATPPGHSRLSYRNFFYPHQRWQFLGLRLAAEAN
ncbi:MAG: ergothioneine biosynthesis protein EgtB [Hyphomicrobium sp.]|uniref:ergothioneine biosynthesis protein EgtB n=1 Tax=Hyphomicrobium sp. TaxID=82 RepID=UPI0039E2205D